MPGDTLGRPKTLERVNGTAPKVGACAQPMGSVACTRCKEKREHGKKWNLYGGVMTKMFSGHFELRAGNWDFHCVCLCLTDTACDHDALWTL